jgi:RimJ/RimL family protein N-acetyltransferase
MKLETQRLFLEKVNLKDGQFIFDLFNLPACIQFIGDRGIYSIDKAKIYIQNSLIKSYNQNGFGLYKIVLKDTQKAIGICGLVKRPVFEHVDIGFAILTEYEGKGYAFEAAQATLKYAHSILKIKTILAITNEDNVRSISLVERLGLKFQKKIKYGEKQDDVLLFSN